METESFASPSVGILEWDGNITDIIWNFFTPNEGLLSFIFHDSIWLRLALIIFFMRICALIRAIKDSNARSSSFWFQLLSALIIIVLWPIFGILLYIAIRPQWLKWDKTPWRDTAFQNIHVCENCKNFNNISHDYCTNCWESLCTSCRECQAKYSKSYAYCPYCWAPHLDE